MCWVASGSWLPVHPPGLARLLRRPAVGWVRARPQAVRRPEAEPAETPGVAEVGVAAVAADVAAGGAAGSPSGY